MCVCWCGRLCGAVVRNACWQERKSVDARRIQMTMIIINTAEMCCCNGFGALIIMSAGDDDLRLFLYKYVLI